MIAQDEEKTKKQYVNCNSSRGVVAFIVLLSIGAPVVINELYKLRSGYLTLWEAKETLQYMGAIIGVLGTLSLGVVTLYMNVRVQIVNEELLKINKKTL